MVPTGGAREIETKQLELLHEMAPSAQTIGFLINATNPYVELDVQDVAAASDRLRRKLVVLRVATRNDLEQTFATVEDRGVSALIRASDPFLCGQRDQVIALANQIGIPKPLKIKRMNALMFAVSIEALSAGRDLMTWRWRRLENFQERS
jgi:putative ABC transport system substrate-binding protein